MRLMPEKLTHGDTLGNLFQKFNAVIDYLREIRLVAGPGIRLNQLPAGTTIESTAITSGANVAGNEGLWNPHIIRESGSIYPVQIEFTNARLNFAGEIIDRISCMLNDDALQLETLYLYAVVSNGWGAKIQWSSEDLGNRNFFPDDSYLPIRFIGKIHISDDDFLFSDLPNGFVKLPGNVNDIVRLSAVRGYQEPADLKDQLDPSIVMHTNALNTELVSNEMSTQVIWAEKSISDFGESSSIFVYYDGGLKALPVASTPGIFPDGHHVFPVCRLGQMGTLGFREITMQQFTKTQTIRNQHLFWSNDRLAIRQLFVYQSISESNTVSIYMASLEISPDQIDFGTQSSKSVILHIYYTDQSVVSHDSRIQVEGISFTPAFDPLPDGYSHIQITIGNIHKANNNRVWVEMYYDLIAIPFNMYGIINPIRADIYDIKQKIFGLDQRVTALEQRN